MNDTVRTPDFVFSNTLSMLLEKYTAFAASIQAPYMCYMYAEECGFSFGAVCDGDVYFDIVPRIIELCPDLFYAGGCPRTIDSWMTTAAEDVLSCGSPAGTWGDQVANLRKNLIKEMIRRFGEDFEFTVNGFVTGE